MLDPISNWANKERHGREAILSELGEEARSMAALCAPGRSVLSALRVPLEIAFATVIGVLCGLVAVLATVMLKIVLG